MINKLLFIMNKLSKKIYYSNLTDLYNKIIAF